MTAVSARCLAGNIRLPIPLLTYWIVIVQIGMHAEMGHIIHGISWVPLFMTSCPVMRLADKAGKPV